MFFLDKPNSNEPTFIFFQPYLSDGRLKYPVRAKVRPDHWVRKAYRIEKKHDKESVNATLNHIDSFFEQLEKDARISCTPLTKAFVYAELDKKLGRVVVRPKSGPKPFFDALDEIIQDRRKGIELTPKTSQRFSDYTVNHYQIVRDFLFKFDPDLAFDTISLDTHKALIAYMVDKFDHSVNMIGYVIKNLKTLMEVARIRKLHSNMIHLDKSFFTPNEETDAVYLDEREIECIYSHECATKIKDLARDWFIIDCFTGLRISDIQLLGAQNLRGDTIQIINEKTGQKVVVPMHPYVKEILKKWSGFPPKVNEGQMNRVIKHVCRDAGIDESFLYSLTKGGYRQDFYYKKWQKISNHTARRTFITRLLEMGMADNEVMQLVGIRVHSTLLRYKKTKAEKAAKIAAEHPFFLGKTAKLRAV